MKSEAPAASWREHEAVSIAMTPAAALGALPGRLSTGFDEPYLCVCLGQTVM